MFTFSNFEHQNLKAELKDLKTYNSTYQMEKSTEFQVFANGQEVPVYTCRISKYPFNRVWPGFQRPINQTEKASFVNLISDEKLELEVSTQLTLDEVRIKPYSKEVKFTIKNGKICFSLVKNGQYILQVGSYHHTLYIFNSKLIEVPNKEEVTYYFDKGIHFPQKIHLKDNESIYVDKDAYVYGWIFAENAKNIKIYGNGIFDGSGEERFSSFCYESYTNGNVKFYDCENVEIHGVGFVNSAIWCINLFHCENVSIDDIKVFGQWRYNTDGIDVVNSQNVSITNSLIQSFDDTITIKGIEQYKQYSNKNIITENCVLYCDWGKPCELGLETICPEYENIVFRNCDIVRGSFTALDIACGNYAEIHNVIFEDIRIEFEKDYTIEEFDGAESQFYSKQDQFARTNIFVLHNRQYKSPTVWGIDAPSLEENKGKQGAVVHDVLVKDIKIYYDKAIACTEEGKYRTGITIYSTFEHINHYNIILENITINNESVTENNIEFSVSNVKNFQLK